MVMTPVERDPASPNYRHVYLYGKSESVRTVVYCAGTMAHASIVKSLEHTFAEEDNRFGKGLSTYSFFKNNCSTLIASALSAQRVVKPGLINSIPVCFFKRFVQERIRASGFKIGKITLFDRAAFALHRFCIGLWGDPQKRMDRWITEETG
jgi:hypothetical protein